MGLFNSGTGNVGFFNSGTGNYGIGNSGSFNSGIGNSGVANTGVFNAGGFNTGWANAGSYNTGGFNAGDFNSGSANPGDVNTGSFNTGDTNTGWANTGNLDTGAFISGDQSNGLLWRGDRQGLIAADYTLTIPDIPLTLTGGGILNIPITGNITGLAIESFSIHGQGGSAIPVNLGINVLGADTGGLDIRVGLPDPLGSVTIPIPPLPLNLHVTIDDTLTSIALPRIAVNPIVLNNLVVGGVGTPLTVNVGGSAGPVVVQLLHVGAAPGLGNATVAPSSGFFNSGAGGVSGFGNIGQVVSGYGNVGSMVSGVKNLGGLLSGVLWGWRCWGSAIPRRWGRGPRVCWVWGWQVWVWAMSGSLMSVGGMWVPAMSVTRMLVSEIRARGIWGWAVWGVSIWGRGMWVAIMWGGRIWGR
ncbi:hypothetical protein A5656_04645 [Mycobacterium gordonae]|nr:hypothetical protein A5656_04645 [Mycobacterium gordonae]